MTVSCALLLYARPAVFAQTHLGSIRGAVLDPSGAPVGNAAYRLVSEETNVTRSGSSGPNGSYGVAQLEPGSYRLEVEVPGYKLSITQATLAVDQRLRLDVRLQLGTVSEQVVVSEDDNRYGRPSAASGWNDGPLAGRIMEISSKKVPRSCDSNSDSCLRGPVSLCARRGPNPSCVNPGHDRGPVGRPRRLLATNALDDAVFIATPALAGGEIILRSQDSLYSIGRVE